MKVDLRRLSIIVRNSDLTFLTLGILLSFMQPFLNTIKWNLLLRDKKITIPFFQLFTNQMSGSFISSFLPSRYSGDVYRTYVIAKYSGNAYDSAASVAVQRLTGLFVMGVLGFLASVLGLYFVNDYALTVAIMGVSVVIVVGSCIPWSEGAFSIIDRLLRRLGLERLRNPAVKFRVAVMEFKNNGMMLMKVMFLSLLFYLQAFAIIFVSAKAVGANVSFIYVMLVVPMIYVVEAMPISVNGLGVREGAFTFFFSRVGLQVEQALAIGLVVLCFRLLKSIIGGVFFMFESGSVSDLVKKRGKVVVG